jgi:hypothetical protein
MLGKGFVLLCVLVCLATSSARADMPDWDRRPPPATSPETDPGHQPRPTVPDRPVETPRHDPVPAPQPDEATAPWFLIGNLVVLLGAAYALLRPRRDPVLEKWGLL